MVSWTIGNTYTHQNLLDLNFTVFSIKLKDNGDINLWGKWINRHYGHVVELEWITIKRRDLCRWEIVA